MPMIMAQKEGEKYPLHRCIFQGSVKTLSSLIRTHDIAEKDKQGNTPLHLAVMLGRKECVQLLLTHGAPVKVKNLAGWSPLAEAISYGDRQTISSLVRKLKQQTREQMEERRPNLVAALHQMGDFYMELKWDFQSWELHCLSWCTHLERWKATIGMFASANIAPQFFLSTLSSQYYMPLL